MNNFYSVLAYGVFMFVLGLAFGSFSVWHEMKNKKYKE